MRKIFLKLLLPALVMVFLSGTVLPVWAQEGGMSNAPATGEKMKLPKMYKSGKRSSWFKAADMDAAQKVCDAFATKHMKAKCTATAGKKAGMFYCNCAEGAEK